MVVLVIDQDCVSIIESEGHTPVAIDPHGPVILKVAGEWMHFPTRQVHIMVTLRSVQLGELQSQSAGMWRLNSRLAALLEEIPKPFVSESFDHGRTVSRIFTIVNNSWAILWMVATCGRRAESVLFQP